MKKHEETQVAAGETETPQDFVHFHLRIREDWPEIWKPICHGVVESKYLRFL